MYNFVASIKNKIDLRREKLKLEIDNKMLSIIESLDEFKISCYDKARNEVNQIDFLRKIDEMETNAFIKIMTCKNLAEKIENDDYQSRSMNHDLSNIDSDLVLTANFLKNFIHDFKKQLVSNQIFKFNREFDYNIFRNELDISQENK